MNENNPPIAPPSGDVCPNCGAARSGGIAYCGNCGAPLPASKSGNSCASVVGVLLVVALVLGALGFGALGACFLLLGASSSNNSPVFTFFGIAVALVIAACAAGFFLIFKKK